MKKRILFYGDSNTYGFDPRDFWGGRYDSGEIWTGILSENPEWEILAYGENGRRIPYRDSEFNQLKRILDNEPDLDCFGIMLGSNDMLVMPDAGPEKIAERMKSAIDFVKKHGSITEKTLILLISPPDIRISEGPYGEMFKRLSKGLGAEYKRIADEEGLYFTDAAKWNLALAYDGVHFSVEGHAQFAEKMTEVLDDILK